MKLSKILFIIFLCFAAFLQVKAQVADTTTVKYRNKRTWYNVVVKLKDNTLQTGYMHYYYPYNPEKKVEILAKGSDNKTTRIIKIKDIESIDYAQMRFVRIKPTNSPKDFFTRQAYAGKVGLYVISARKSVYVPLLPGVAAIPYVDNDFFLEKDGIILKLDRENFQGQLLAFVGDNPILAEKIKNKEFKYKDTEIVVSEYNKLP